MARGRRLECRGQSDQNSQTKEARRGKELETEGESNSPANYVRAGKTELGGRTNGENGGGGGVKKEDLVRIEQVNITKRK